MASNHTKREIHRPSPSTRRIENCELYAHVETFPILEDLLDEINAYQIHHRIEQAKDTLRMGQSNLDLFIPPN